MLDILGSSVERFIEKMEAANHVQSAQPAINVAAVVAGIVLFVHHSVVRKEKLCCERFLPRA